MAYRMLDLEQYQRRQHFEYFRSLANPYVGVTVEIDLTDFFDKIRQKNIPFFLSFLYIVGNAANSIPQLRQRIFGGSQIIEFDKCPSSITVLKADESFAYCDIHTQTPFEDYLVEAKNAQVAARVEGNIDHVTNEEAELSRFFVSSTPWFTYTSILQPTPVPADSNPRITWGKYHEVNGRIMIPVSILAHHALVDGLHIGQFYEQINRNIQELL